MIASMSPSLVLSPAVRASRSKLSHEDAVAHLLAWRWLIRAYRDLAGNETDAIAGGAAMDAHRPNRRTEPQQPLLPIANCSLFV